jgi:hypothetical protein
MAFLRNVSNLVPDHTRSAPVSKNSDGSKALDTEEPKTKHNNEMEKPFKKET